MNKNQLKTLLLQRCNEQVGERIEAARKAMDAAQSAANEEGKSTAGDKYDTARAMNQIDRDMYAKQLTQTVQLQQSLNAISPEKELDKVSLGSVVHTTAASYFVAISLGVVTLNDQEFVVISPMTPLAQAMLNKRKGDVFVFNKLDITIEEIF